jgi:hypothetical protein
MLALPDTRLRPGEGDRLDELLLKVLSPPPRPDGLRDLDLLGSKEPLIHFIGLDILGYLVSGYERPLESKREELLDDIF